MADAWYYRPLTSLLIQKSTQYRPHQTQPLVQSFCWLDIKWTPIVTFVYIFITMILQSIVEIASQRSRGTKLSEIWQDVMGELAERDYVYAWVVLLFLATVTETLLAFAYFKKRPDYVYPTIFTLCVGFCTHVYRIGLKTEMHLATLLVTIASGLFEVYLMVVLFSYAMISSEEIRNQRLRENIQELHSEIEKGFIPAGISLHKAEFGRLRRTAEEAEAEAEPEPEAEPAADTTTNV